MNTQQKLIFTVGIQASGKSTWAKQMVKDFPGKYKRVNKDDLRLMMDLSEHSEANEKFVLKIRDSIIYNALCDGWSVIVDDTNCSEKHEKRFIELVDDVNNTLGLNIIVEHKIFNLPKDICIDRNKKRDNPVPEKAIHFTYSTFKKSKYYTEWLEHQRKQQLKPKAIIVDIDRTLTAQEQDRSPYDYTKLASDIPNKEIIKLVNSYRTLGSRIILVTGRPEKHRVVTQEWLNTHHVEWDDLFMRADDDKSHDYNVKEDIYHRLIEPIYNVTLVLEDRTRNVNKWRELGLLCLQVVEGDY